MAAHRINFVNEHDTRCVLFSLLKHIANTTGTDTDKHLHKVGAGDSKERHIRLARHRAGGQGLTGTRWADQQNTFRNLATQPLELVRIFEKLDNFLQLILGFINAGHIIKSHATRFFGQQLGFAFAKPHRFATAALHLTHEENPDTDEQKHREPRHQQLEQRGLGFRFWHSGNFHARGPQTVHHIGPGGDLSGKA